MVKEEEKLNRIGSETDAASGDAGNDVIGGNWLVLYPYFPYYRPFE